MNKAPRFKICLLVLCALLFVGACKKAPKKVLLSSDERFEIAVPGGWKSEANLHDDAQVQASHEFTNQFLLVIGEDKGDFDDLNLDEYCDITVKGMEEKLNLFRKLLGPFQALGYGPTRTAALGFKFFKISRDLLKIFAILFKFGRRGPRNNLIKVIRAFNASM